MLFKVIVDNKYVKKYEQYLFGGGKVSLTDNDLEAGKFPELVAREIASGLRELGKETMIKKF